MSGASSCTAPDDGSSGKLGAHGDSPLLLVPMGEAGLIGRLQSELKAKDALIRELTNSLSHSRKVFERASQAARIGVWECELPSQALRWTDVVYDLFELPRGSALVRDQILRHYPEASRRALEKLRSEAIAACGSFNLDTEIVTAQGRQRWLRITATVESKNGVPIRLFGMKQDITEEKLLWERTRYLAEFDVLTGLANRSQFQALLGEAGGIGALALVDLDDFKQINDTYGHAIGDAGLKEAARRLLVAAKGAKLVARIGGDEFAVLLAAPFDPASAARVAEAIVATMRAPFASGGIPLRLSASVGLAAVEGCDITDVFAHADSALYAAKAAGRNTFRIFQAP